MQTWSVLGHFTHNLTPTFRASIGAGYGQVSTDTVGAALFNPAVAHEQDLLEVFAVLEWNPVPRTSFMIDVNYGHVDFNRDAPLLPTGVRADDSGGAWTGTFQVTRSF